MVNVTVNLKGSATVQLHLHDGGLFSLFYRSRILVPRGPHAPVLHTSVLPGQDPQSKDKRSPSEAVRCMDIKPTRAKRGPKVMPLRC